MKKGYKVIWDNGRNSATYRTLDCALSKIKELIEGHSFCGKHSEVKLEVVEDRGE